MKTTLKENITAFYHDHIAAQRETLLFLALTAPLLMVWLYFGKRQSYAILSNILPAALQNDFYGTLFEYLSFFLLLGLIPALIITLGFKKPLKYYGLQWGDWRAGLRWVAVGIPVLLVLAYFSAQNPAMQLEYPLAKSTLADWGRFWLVEAAYLLFYYTAWEFFFRGVLLQSVGRSYGLMMALLIQTIPSALIHIGKPGAESFASIIAGLVFGWVAWRTRSFIYPLLLHAFMGISLDLLIALRVL